ncbi:hypothetical protein ACT7DG_13800 [Bacillus cereus]
MQDKEQKKVVTCEVNEELAELAQYNIDKAGFSDIVTVVNMKSSELIDKKDIGFFTRYYIY